MTRERVLVRLRRMRSAHSDRKSRTNAAAIATNLPSGEAAMLAPPSVDTFVNPLITNLPPSAWPCQSRPSSVVAKNSIFAPDVGTNTALKSNVCDR